MTEPTPASAEEPAAERARHAAPPHTRRPWRGRVRPARRIPRTSIGEFAALQMIALFKAVKCASLLVVGLTLLAVIERGQDLGELARTICHLVGLNEQRHFIAALIERAASITMHQEKVAAGVSLGYSAVLAVEATGLWLRRAWAAWLSVVIGGLLLPVELYELHEKPSVRLAVAFVVNAAIVAYLIIEARRAGKHAA